MKEQEGASKERSSTIVPSQDIKGVANHSSMVVCQWTRKDKGAKWALQSPSCLPGKFLPVGIWAGPEELREEGPLIWLNFR